MVTQGALGGGGGARLHVHGCRAGPVDGGLPDPGEVQTVLWLFLVVMIVDGTDGMLARRLRVKTLVPNFDGFCSTTSSTTSPTPSRRWCCCGRTGTCPTAPRVASSRPSRCWRRATSSAAPTPKTDDHFFLGFPSYSNIVAFYVIRAGMLDLISPCTVFDHHRPGVRSHQVPVPFPHRELLVLQHDARHPVARAVGGDHGRMLPDAPVVLVGLSLVYVVYYVVVSLWLTFSPASAHPQSGLATSALPDLDFLPVALTIGIVGLPNAGKSTLFNALTQNDVLAANYPFATIEPNVGVVLRAEPRPPLGRAVRVGPRRTCHCGVRGHRGHRPRRVGGRGPRQAACSTSASRRRSAR